MTANRILLRALFVLILHQLTSSCVQNMGTIKIIDDSFVNNLSPNSTCGDLKFMHSMSWTRNGMLNRSTMYLNFDLEGISTSKVLKSLTLETKFDSFINNSNAFFKKYEGNNNLLISIISDTWDEESLTWNNKPEVIDDFEYRVKGPGDSCMDFKINLMPIYKFITAKKIPFNGITIEIEDKKPYSVFYFPTKEHEGKKQTKISVSYF